MSNSQSTQVLCTCWRDLFSLFHPLFSGIL